MGKTFRCDGPFDTPEAKKVKRVYRRVKDCAVVVYSEDALSAAQYASLLERISDMVRYRIEKMIEDGIIEAGDRVFRAFWLYRRAAELIPRYDPARKGAASGRKASLFTFISRMLDYDVRMYRRRILAERSRFVEIRDGLDPSGCGAECGSGWCLSDRCRSVEALIFRMDFETLLGMLAADERECLLMRMEGCGIEEISDALGCGANKWYRFGKLMRNVAKAAVKCGYLPKAEREAGKK